MATEPEIDASATDEIVCPHCGHEHDNSYEHYRDHAGPLNNVKTECDKCGEAFEFYVEFTPCYWSSVPKRTERPRE